LGYGGIPSFDSGKVQQVMCIIKPDIDYTSNKDLVVGELYLSNRIVDNTESFGQFITGDVWSMDVEYLGNYFLRYFEFISEMRERQIASIFNG
jgi:hypothetical protein